MKSTNPISHLRSGVSLLLLRYRLMTIDNFDNHFWLNPNFPTSQLLVKCCRATFKPEFILYENAVEFVQGYQRRRQ